MIEVLRLCERCGSQSSSVVYHIATVSSRGQIEFSMKKGRFSHKKSRQELYVVHKKGRGPHLTRAHSASCLTRTGDTLINSQVL